MQIWEQNTMCFLKPIPCEVSAHVALLRSSFIQNGGITYWDSPASAQSGMNLRSLVWILLSTV